MSILYTDIEAFPCAVLEARAADGGLPPGRVLPADITCIAGGRLRRTLKTYQQIHLFCGIGASPLGLAWAGWPLDGEQWSIVTGGFPCQDISSAGLGAGLDGERSGLFWEMMRVVRIRKPAWVLAENVGALAARGLDRVVRAMGEAGYAVVALRLGAWAVGAPHERERWWIVCRRVEGAGTFTGVGQADAGEERRGAGSREPHRRGEPARGAQQSGRVADTDESGQPTCIGDIHTRQSNAAGCSRNGFAPGPVGSPTGPGLEGQRTDAGSPQEPQPGHAGPHGDARELADAHEGGLRAERRVGPRTDAEQSGQGDEQLEHAHRLQQPGEPVHSRQGEERCGAPDAGWRGADIDLEHANGGGRRIDEQERQENRGTAAGWTGSSNFADPRRWPHPPLVDGNGNVLPTPQHDWEPQRLHQRPVGDGPDGLSPRLAGYLNKCGVAALGNAQVPQCVMVIARAMMEAVQQEAQA